MKKNAHKIYWILLILILSINLMLILSNFITKQDFGFYFIFFVASVPIIIFLIIWIIFSINKNISNEIKEQKNIRSLVFQKIMKFGSIGYLLYDDDYTIVWMSDYLTYLFGYDYIGKNIKSLGIKKSDTNNININKIIFNNFCMEYKFIAKLKVLIFKDITLFNNQIKVYDDETMAFGIINIDNYNKILNSASETNAFLLNKNIVEYLLSWCWRKNILIKKISVEQYFIISTKNTIEKLSTGDEFEVFIENFRKNTKKLGSNINFSFGIAFGINDPLLLYNEALKAIELSLSRGGDQLVIKNVNTYDTKIFGDEKMGMGDLSKNKLKQFSNRLIKNIKNSNKVVITGHLYPDYDSIGASLGVYIICKLLNKNVKIIINKKKVDSITIKNVESIIGKENFKNAFIDSSNLKNFISKNTKFISLILDTSSSDRVEMNDVILYSEKVIIIDHHRVSEDNIINSTDQYIDTFSSSTCEIITEILSFQFTNDKLIERSTFSSFYSIILAGITIDTQNFKYKTTSKTFEAASKLKTWGAVNSETDILLKESFETLSIINSLLQNVVRWKGSVGIAIGKSDRFYSKKMLAICSQELINIKGINIAITIAFTSRNTISASCRSIGNEINLQKFAEKFENGGGHFNAAAFEMKNATLISAKKNIIKLLNDFQYF